MSGSQFGVIYSILSICPTPAPHLRHIAISSEIARRSAGDENLAALIFYPPPPPPFFCDSIGCRQLSVRRFLSGQVALSGYSFQIE